MLKVSKEAQKMVAKPDIPEENIDGPVTLRAMDFEKSEMIFSNSEVVYEGQFNFSGTSFMSFLLNKHERTEMWHFTANLHTPRNIAGGETRLDIVDDDLESILEWGARVVDFMIVLNLN